MSMQSAIEKGIDDGFKGAAPGIVDTVMSALWNHPAYPVIVGAQVRLMQAGVKPDKAWPMAKESLAAFLKENRIELGDPAYDWSTDAGRIIAEEMEIEHWDSHDPA